MKVAIVSLRFAPGHIAHLRAYYALFELLGCETKFFLDKKYDSFLKDNKSVVLINNLHSILAFKPDILISYNIANENIRLFKLCRKLGIKCFYVLHEPWDSMKELLAHRSRVPRRIAANIVNYLTCKNAYKVILASNNGVLKYERFMKNCNTNYAVFPLIFCDDYDDSIVIKREYFSFIGGFTETRGRTGFLDFVEYAISKHLNIKFVIASRDNVSSSLKSATLRKAIIDGNLLIYEGRPMTGDEINLHYRKSICIWNAYNNSTQSSVLSNALMQGSPVIVSKRGVAEDIITHKKEGCFVSIPHDNQEILKSYMYILENINDFENNARNTFLNKCYYKNFIIRAKELFEIE